MFADLCRTPDTVDSPRRRAVAQRRERGLNPQKSAGRRQARDDGETLTRSMQRSRKGVPTIARAALVPAKKQRQPDAADHQPHGPRPKKWRNMSGKAPRRRAIRAYNHQRRARAVRQQREDGT